MKTPFALITLLLFIFAMSSVCASDPLATLRNEHPRLLFVAQDWAAFEARVKSRAADSQFDRLLSQLEKNARDIVAAPPVENKKIGRRLLDKSREALRRVITLAIVYRATGNADFLLRAEKEMLHVGSFPDWTPSHFLDTAEMTAALALGYDWLFDKLSPATRATLRDAIAEKGLKAVTGRRLPRNNWLQVCHGGLSLGALAIAEDVPELARATLDNARRDIVDGLAPYAPDGIYPEGPSYWSYGTSYQVLLIAALESALGTDWDLTRSPGFMASANTRLLLSGPSGDMFNFSDCGSQRFFDPVLFWFAKKLNNPALLANDFLNSDTKRFTMPLAALWWPKDGIAAKSQPCALPLAWKGEGINPIAVFRSSWTDPDALYLACKAGAANASHGHMDAGSFILEADSVRWALDLGSQDYESLESKGMRIFGRAQDAVRWTIFRMNNFSHNTLVIGDQLHRTDGRAEFTHFSENGELAMDLSKVLAGQAASARRAFNFDPAKRTVRISDELKGVAAGEEVRWAMVTKAKIEISENGSEAILRQDKKTLRAKVFSDLKFEVIPAEAAQKNNYDEANPDTWILIVCAKAPASGEVRIVVELGGTP